MTRALLASRCLGILAVTLLPALGCSTRPPDAKCQSDLNCPTDFFCGATLVCESLPSNFAVTPQASTAAVFAGDVVKLVVTNVGGVVWSLLEGSTAGSIEQDGTYHAPIAAGTFHAIATSTADPAKAATITLTVTFLAPVQPVITAPDPVTTGATGLIASTVAHSGMTYAWTISGGTITSASSGTTDAGKNSITFSAGAVGTLSFTCVETNAGSVSSAQGTKSIQVIAAPVTPTIAAASPVFTGSTGRTASVTARTGYTYKWTLSGGTLLTADTGIVSSGLNTVTWTAGAVGTATFTCIEINAAGAQSAPGTAQVSIVPASPLTSPSPITEGATSTASIPAASGHTYAWTISGGTFTGAGGAAGTTTGSTNTVTFTAGTPGPLHLTCTESGSGTTFSADVDIVAAPSITSFVANPTLVTTGQTVSLTGMFSGGTGVVDQAVGAVQSGVAKRSSAAITVQPTVFTLTVTNLAGTTATSTATVTITNGSFSNTGPLGTARSGASTTRLGNGKILVVGGVAGTTVLASAEIYDPTAGTFAPTTGPLAAAREGHTATLLSDGRVLIAGGDDGESSLTSAEVFDVVAGTFSPTTGPLGHARTQHTAGLLASGKVLVAGGSAGGADVISAELFDPVAGTFGATGDLQVARRDAVALRLWTGEILITGGRTSAPSYLSSAELYAPDLGTFSLTTGGLTGARARHAMAPLPDGRVLVAGGESATNAAGILASAERYDPIAKTFSATGALKKARRNFGLTALGTGKVIVTAGEGSAGPIDTLESYDDAGTGTFTQLPGSLAPARQLASTALLGDGRVLVAGGKDATGAITGAVLYDPSEPAPGTWTASTQMLAQQRYGHTATLLGDGRVLLASGYTGTSCGSGCNEMHLDGELFNPKTGLVTTASNTMTTKRTGGLAVRLGDGRVLIAGGYGSTGAYTAAAEIFDPRTNTFAPTGAMTMPRLSAAAVLLGNGKVLVVGGINDDYSSDRSAELYDPGAGAFTAVPTAFPAALEFVDGLTLQWLPTGKALLTGASYGDTTKAYLYDPVANSFGATGSLVSTYLVYTTPVLLPSGKLLLAGGQSGSIYTAAFLYDPWAGTFAATGSMSTGHTGATGFLLPNGKVLIAGTLDLSGVNPNVAHLYDGGTFTAATHLITGGQYPGVVLPDGRAALFGASGAPGGLGYLRSIELYR